MTSHSFINIVAALPREQEQAAIEAADKLGNPVKEPLSGVIRSLNCVHFFSINIVPSDEKTPPFLVMELSVDGNSTHFLNLLADKAGQYFEPVFKLIKGYSSKANLSSFWKAHLVETGVGYMSVPGLGHCGTPGMSVERIHKEDELSATLSDIYNKTDRRGSALEIVNRIRASLQKKQGYDWAFTPVEASLLKGRKKAGLISAILPALPNFIATFLWPFLILAFILAIPTAIPLQGTGIATVLAGLAKFLFAFFGIFLLLSLAFISWVYTSLRKLEKADIPDDTPPNHATMSKIRAREDYVFQNNLAGISIMKAGIIRKIMIRLIFWLVSVVSARLYNPGFLGDIGTIHFARWLTVPGTNRLLFFSNFGGSWESYLEDFITKANFGLTGVWGNTIGFPKTKNLVFDGASDGDRFKRWARRQQNPTWCWYSGYPSLTTTLIRTNAAIRQGIGSVSTETEAQDWLMLFSSDVLPRTELQSDNIQALLFGGFVPLTHAKCVTVRLPEDVKQSRHWLAQISSQIRFGDRRPQKNETAIILSLASTALQKLGLSEQELSGFPHAFVAGMAARSRILGDEDESSPSDWLWGGKNRVDAALLVYASDESKLDELVAEQEKAIKKIGGEVVYKIPLKVLPPKGTPIREPFGFVDGVSQPVIRGIGRHKPGINDMHIVEPGEFIMGYPDGLGTYPQTPTVPAIFDSHNNLYATPSAWAEKRPDFSNSLAGEERDLGRDGSFMVVRQLEQDTEGFTEFLSEAARQLKEGPAGIEVDEHWVAAKMVGRWKDGSSLVRNPYRPATESFPDMSSRQ